MLHMTIFSRPFLLCATSVLFYHYSRFCKTLTRHIPCSPAARSHSHQHTQTTPRS